MNRAVSLSLVGIAIVCGIVAGTLASRSPIVRDKLGTLAGRGHLLALVHDRGLYDADVDRSIEESNYLAATVHPDVGKAERHSVLKNLIAEFVSRANAESQAAAEKESEHEAQVLRSQFGDEKIWRAALNRSALSTRGLSRLVRENLRTRRWISKQIAAQIEVTDAECRAFYESQMPNFFVPERIHASHLFLTAPPETPPDVLESKRLAIEALFVRLAKGEDFAVLVSEHSEDEATKLRAGDLGYFDANRMPPDFFAAAMKLHPGELGKPLRTRLGFHIIKFLDRQPARERTFEEVRGDIAIQLTNEKRATAVPKLIVDLSADASYLRPL